MKTIKNLTLSIVLATYNEEKNLRQCLNSIKDIADEIIIVDGGSTDNTIKTAEEYKAKIIQTDNPPIFHINKQKAVDNARGEWILQLDADEVVGKSLEQEIKSSINQNNDNTNAYYVSRKNYFCGKWMKHGGMWPDPVIRLFKNGKGKFPCKSVHEQIEIDGKVGYLKESLDHYSYKSIGEYIVKNKRYIRLETVNHVKNKTPKSTLKLIEYCIVKPTRTFFTLFFRSRGFLDGYLGFIWAYYSATFHAKAFIRYWRLE
jgi:glycosyltransferase involved in cell wall biosynthesis